MEERALLVSFVALIQFGRLLNAGFSEREASRLIKLRMQIRSGNRPISSRSVEDNRLAFLKWLVDHGKVSEW